MFARAQPQGGMAACEIDSDLLLSMISLSQSSPMTSDQRHQLVVAVRNNLLNRIDAEINAAAEPVGLVAEEINDLE